MFNISINKANINSKLFFINPVLKIIIVLIFSILVFCLKNVFAVLACLLISTFYSLWAEKNISKILRYIWSLKWFYLFIFIFNYIISNSLLSSLISVGQLLAIFLFNISLIKSTGKRDMEYGLFRILSPFNLFKIDVNSIVMIISLIIRFLPEIISSENKILQSQYSRGINYKNSGLSNRLKIIYSSIIPLINISIKKSDEIADTMDVRCYNVNLFSTWKRKTGFCDIIYLIVNVFILFAVVCLEVYL